MRRGKGREDLGEKVDEREMELTMTIELANPIVVDSLTTKKSGR